MEEERTVARLRDRSTHVVSRSRQKALLDPRLPARPRQPGTHRRHRRSGPRRADRREPPTCAHPPGDQRGRARQPGESRERVRRAARIRRVRRRREGVEASARRHEHRPCGRVHPHRPHDAGRHRPGPGKRLDLSLRPHGHPRGIRAAGNVDPGEHPGRRASRRRAEEPRPPRHRAHPDKRSAFRRAQAFCSTDFTSHPKGCHCRANPFVQTPSAQIQNRPTARPPAGREARAGRCGRRSCRSPSWRSA